jgi:hypothetical protein
MMVTTKSTVTVTMTGTEAHRLAVWLYENGAEKQPGPGCDLLLMLRELPEEMEVETA